MLTKTCTKCGQEKLMGDFYLYTSAARGKRVHSYCKPCSIESAHKWAKDHKKQVNEKRREKWKAYPEEAKRRALSKYHLSLEEFNGMLELQESKCAVCGTYLATKQEQCIDHNHACCPTECRSCGKCVRGILCQKCNRALSLVHDNVLILTTMIAYLKGYNEAF